MKKATTVYQSLTKIFNIQSLKKFSSYILRGRRKSMSLNPDELRGEEREDYPEVGEVEREVQDMSVMLTVTDGEGRSLPEGCLTVPNIARLFQERTAHLPYDVSIINSRHALVDFEKGVPILEVSREIHGATSWGELPVCIGCVVSGKASLLNIVQEEELRQQQKEEVRTNLSEIKREQEEYQQQFVDVVQAMRDEIQALKKKETVVPFPGAPLGTTADLNGKVVFKITKAPELPKFSGADPVPREEGSFEQWYFQVKGSQGQHTADAIRSGIVNSVRGEARDLVEYVGFDAPIESILSRLEHRFRKAKSTDRLQHDFFQLGQEKSEGVQQYAGRLEN